MVPNTKEEEKLWAEGYEFVAGLDEAGRGPLAGPVVAAVVLVVPQTKHTNKLEFVRVFSGMKDSKKLSQRQREFFYKKLTNHKNIKWGVGIVSEKQIDKINILQATKLAMKKSIKNISRNSHGRRNWEKPDFIILDGNFKINSKLPQKSIIRADGKVFSCAAAGIIAKVTRDRIMKNLHKKYPHYGFDKHKGYGTKLHLKNLYALGPCKIHRKTFFPVSALAQGLAKNEII